MATTDSETIYHCRHCRDVQFQSYLRMREHVLDDHHERYDQTIPQLLNKSIRKEDG